MNKNKFLLKYIKTMKIQFILWMILTIIFMAMYFLAMVTWSYSFEAISELQFKKFLVIVLITQFISIFSYILNTYKNFIYIKIENKFANNVMNDLYEKMINLPCIAYEKMGVGEIVNRLTGDCKTVIETLASLFNLLIKTVIVIGIIIYCFYIQYMIGILFILLGLTVFIITNYYLPSIKKREKELKDISDNYLKEVNETFVGIREVKALGIKYSIVNSTKNKFSKYFKINENQRKKETVYYELSNIIFEIFELMILICTGYFLYKNHYGIAVFLLIMNCTWRINEVVSGLSDFGIKYSKLTISIKRIGEILNNELYQDEKYGTYINDNPDGLIEFKNVSFKYSDEDETVIKNLSVKFKPNQKIAIVGRSGNGKSTIFNLLSRFFDATEGEILIDGIDIKEYDETSLRKMIAVIRQNPYMFNKNIIENFKLVNKDLTLEEIREACKKSYIDDYIMSLPMKYDTVIGEGGVNLSGGQKQRIAIARALLTNAKIFLFDEATSALDNESQEYVKKTINDLTKTHTVIIIAHRLNTVSDADIIHVVDNGSIEQSGNKDELLKSSLIFNSLYSNDN